MTWISPSPPTIWARDEEGCVSPLPFLLSPPLRLRRSPAPLLSKWGLRAYLRPLWILDGEHWQAQWAPQGPAVPVAWHQLSTPRSECVTQPEQESLKTAS